ncbi:MAG: AAA family ATPase [Patescibacteria group bacterium]|nr:AAA family ATPase [Patescibacteria group bacterium]MDD4611229.1 AAA family ATPase [Patescibacteria group bacterium]
MIITFGGTPGSGKSTIAKKLAAKLGWPRYYMGGIRRDIAKKRGMTLAEYNKLGENDPTTDTDVDNYQENLGKTMDNIIVEGRTSWFFIPHSFKIYVDVNKETGAKRILKELRNENDRNENKNLKTLSDVIKSFDARMRSDRKRYKKYFNINVNKKSNYDFVLDTTNLNRAQAFNAVWKYIKPKIDKK